MANSCWSSRALVAQLGSEDVDTDTSLNARVRNNQQPTPNNQQLCVFPLCRISCAMCFWTFTVGLFHDGRSCDDWIREAEAGADDFAHGGNMSECRSQRHWRRPLTTAFRRVGGQQRTTSPEDRRRPAQGRNPSSSRNSRKSSEGRGLTGSTASCSRGAAAAAAIAAGLCAAAG